MTIDINQLWTILSESDLIAGEKTQALFSSFSADQSVDKNSKALAKWLVAQKAISSYQAKILTAGHSGPFRYGSYLVVDQIESGLMHGQFKARHVKTGYPVLLHFFPGNDPVDLKTWQKIESTVEQLVPIEHPNLAETFESVVLSNRRFVVAQLPSGESLYDKLPRKSRLPWKKACLLIAQAAQGLAALHKQNVVHGAVSPRTIWLETNGLVQLRMNAIPDLEFEFNQASETGECKLDYLAPESVTQETTLDELCSRDLYALGCTLSRMIAGRSPFSEPDPAKKKQQQLAARSADLSKYELPTELDQLIKRLLHKRRSERPTSATEVATLLGLLSGKANEINSLAIPISKSRNAFRRSLSEFLPAVQKTDVAAAPEIETVAAPDPEAAQELAEARLAKIQTAADSASKRKRGKWKIPAAIAGTLLLISGVIGWLAMTADRIVIEQPLVNKTSTTASVEPPKDPNVNEDLAKLPPSERPTLLQELIADDDQSLWESPTNGPPIQFSFLPSATKMLFVFRPSEIVATDEGLRLVKSLGPAFASRIAQLENQFGVDLENISELTVSLHTTENYEYESYFIIRTLQPIETTRLMQNWNRPAIRTLENQQTIYESADATSAYYVIYDPVAAGVDAESEEPQTTVDQPIRRFAFGSKHLIEEVAGNLGVSILPTTFTHLAESTDQDRHVNVLFLRNSLFNEEGQKLMGLENISFNRELGVMIPDDVRGGLLSLHLDSGSYVELMLDKNVDLKSNALKTIMINAFRSRRDMLMGHVAKIPASPYWDNVRIRYGGMLANFYQNIRWDVEHGEVIANCWLPPMAAHNLIAASEHVMAFSTGTTPATVTNNVGPQSLEELLNSKRDLNIANPPDLNVLMADLRNEIVDDFPKLPFAFNIRLLGGDLEKEGITKNQRPSELVMSQKTVAEILTSIMTSANPAKDISGANDPNCKLIWVIANDPDNPGEKAVLVTTRKAAAEKSYELPPAFQLE